MDENIRKQSIIYGLSKYSTVAVTLLTTAILSRILTPEECGVVSVVTVFTALFAVISDMGLGTAVIQERSITKSEINDVYSFSVYASVVMALLFFWCGFIIAWFYEDRIYRSICALLSISVLFNSMNIIPNAVLMKQKRFSLVGNRLIVTSVLTGAVAIVLALNRFSYYSLVLQSVFQSVLVFAWNALSTGVRFHFRLNMDIIHRIKSFSLFQFLFSIINYFARNMDNLLIGKVMGKASLGYYDKGYKLMMYPVQNLTYVINPIVHPVLSEHQDDKEYIYGAYSKEVTVLSFIGVFISAACFLCGREIILLFFGSQWEDAVPVFKLLCLSVWPQIISSSAGSIYQSTGKTKLMFKSGILHFGTVIALIAIGVSTHDLKTVAALVTVGMYARFFIDYFFLIRKDFGYSYASFLRIFKIDLLSALCMALSIVFLSKISTGKMILDLIAKGLSISAIFALISFADGRFKVVIKILSKRKGKVGDTVGK